MNGLEMVIKNYIDEHPEVKRLIEENINRKEPAVVLSKNCKGCGAKLTNKKCLICEMALSNGYYPCVATGRNRGYGCDSGVLIHAVPPLKYRALCGFLPGDKSGWVDYDAYPYSKDIPQNISCKRCLEVIEKKKTKIFEKKR